MASDSRLSRQRSACLCPAMSLLLIYGQTPSEGVSGWQDCSIRLGLPSSGFATNDLPPGALQQCAAVSPVVYLGYSLTLLSLMSALLLLSSSPLLLSLLSLSPSVRVWFVFALFFKSRGCCSPSLVPAFSFVSVLTFSWTCSERILDVLLTCY